MKKQKSRRGSTKRQSSQAPKLLWAPWRAPYIEGISSVKGCIFCRLFRQSNDSKNLIVRRSAHSIAILNRYPYNNGHLLILPKRHVAAFDQLNSREVLDLIELQNQMLKRLKQALKPDGFNLGTNLGRVAGAGVPGHLHVHIVPRWAGDTNFMPVIGKTKIISQSLRALCDLL